MANDRMYIKCTGCGKAVMLAKHFASPWGVHCYQEGYTMEYVLGVFFEEHFKCGNYENKNYKIVYESGDERYKPESHEVLVEIGKGRDLEYSRLKQMQIQALEKEKFVNEYLSKIENPCLEDIIDADRAYWKKLEEENDD